MCLGGLIEGVKVQVNHPSSGCHTVRRVDADLVALIWVKIHPLDFFDRDQVMTIA